MKKLLAISLSWIAASSTLLDIANAQNVLEKDFAQEITTHLETTLQISYARNKGSISSPIINVINKSITQNILPALEPKIITIMTSPSMQGVIDTQINLIEQACIESIYDNIGTFAQLAVVKPKNSAYPSLFEEILSTAINNREVIFKGIKGFFKDNTDILKSIEAGYQAVNDHLKKLNLWINEDERLALRQKIKESLIFYELRKWLVTKHIPLCFTAPLARFILASKRGYNYAKSIVFN